MSEPFIAEVRIFAGNFAPRSWAFCNGQLLPISQNTALFSLIGTTYGGDGRSTTALPDLRGRAPMHPGTGSGLTSRRLGERLGEASVTISETQMASHNHDYMLSSQMADESGTTNPEDNAPGVPRRSRHYLGAPTNLVDQTSFNSVGGDQAHNNVQPYLGLNFIIALQGLYPSRS